jgi:hypothetical protein
LSVMNSFEPGLGWGVGLAGQHCGVGTWAEAVIGVATNGDPWKRSTIQDTDSNEI